MSVTFLFPGQGAQYVGMGRDLYDGSPAAKALYDEANDVLGYDLAALCFDGPGETLGRTEHAQPALLVHSLACHAAWREAGGDLEPAAVAGHSVGEYPALVVAGALTFADALRLVAARGRAMAEHGTGAMCALSMSVADARPVAARFFCDVAVHNLPRQTVIGGRAGDVAALRAHLAAHKQSPGVVLATSGAFHTHLMVHAALAFRADLDAAEFSPPRVRALSNHSGDYHAPEAEALRAQLFFQIFHPVRWVDLMARVIDDGHTTFIEFGGGSGSGRRARLEQITKRLLRAHRAGGSHRGAISFETIASAVN